MIKLPNKVYVIVAVLTTLAVLTLCVVDAILFGKEATSTFLTLIPAVLGWVFNAKGK